MDTSALLTEAEAAARLVMRPQTLNKWRIRRRGPRYLKIGGKVRYRAADVEAFIAAGVVDPAHPRRKRAR